MVKDHASIWPLEIKKPSELTEQLQIAKICSLGWCLRKKKLAAITDNIKAVIACYLCKNN